MKRLFHLLIFLICFFSCASTKRIVLPIHFVSGKNVLTQEMLSKENTTYIINNNYDLQGAEIKIPAGSTLLIKQNGCLTNGSIKGNSSNVISSSEKFCFNNITISGTWEVSEIYSKWFRFSSDPNLNTKNFRSMCVLSDDNHKGTIYIAKGDYPITVNKTNEDCFVLNSNTELIIDGTIRLMPNDLKEYHIIKIKNKQNISVYGSGTIIGDVEKHQGEEGQWGMGIEILSSENIIIRNLTIKKCWGDCVYIGQSKYVKESHSKNVLLENIICDAGRRQGMSIIAGKDIMVKNSKFINTGTIKFTKPGAGIDIEPNKPGNTVVDNIIIDNCYFQGNHNNLDILTYYLDETSSVTIKNCQLQGNIKIGKYSQNVTVDGCTINSVIPEISLIQNIEIKNTKMKKRFNKSVNRTTLRFENCSYN